MLGRQIINWRRSFSLIWKASSHYTVFWCVLLVIEGILPGLLVYLTKHLVDSLVLALNSHGVWEEIRPAIFFASATAIIMLFSNAADSALEIVQTAQADIIQDYVKSLIHDKCAVVDIADYESHQYHDQLEQAISDGANRPLSLLESTGGLIQNGITLLVMGGLLIQYNVWLPLVLLISTLPAFVIILRYDREYHRWWRGTTSQRRWIQYFDLMLTNNYPAAEVRLFNLNFYLQSRYQKLRKELRIERLSQTRRLGIAKFFSGVFALLILAAVIGWMGWKALLGALTLGDLALFYQAFNRGQGVVKTLFGSLGKIIKDSLFLSVLFEFLDSKSNITDPPSPAAMPQNLKEGIRLRNVTFGYPDTNKLVFEDFSLFIPAGKAVAIVGENGSGKTTLIKLLCRFYDPQSGSIEFDGIDIRKFRVREHLRSITTIFQMPLRHQAKANESIAMGDIAAAASVGEIESAAEGSGAHDFILRLPDKYDTLLGRAHDKGAELSGGEWQRLALARAYFRKAPVVLLDEPTSFMDSWAESDWFQRFRDLTENQTSLIITHRFTIAMRADIIFVMDKGKVVESGAHSELIKLDGSYAKSWKEQMRAAEIPDEIENKYEIIKDNPASLESVNP